MRFLDIFRKTKNMTPDTLHADELTRLDRIRGGVYGLLIGDALGVPYEFHPAAEIPDAGLVEMVPPKGFFRAHEGVPPGTWSDDGAQALLLLESLRQNPELSLTDFAALLVRWYKDGYMTPDGRVFDIGIQTRRALGRLMEGVAPDKAGPASERENGNGALMRVLPVVFFAKTPLEVEELAMRQSVVTHGHIRAQLSCALYSLTAFAILQGATAADAVTFAEDHLLERYSMGPHETELKVVLDGRHEVPEGSGYVVDSLWSGIKCVLSTSDYETCVRKAIQLGEDTDTTACVAGGLAGLLYGEGALPSRWKSMLKGQAIVESLLEGLV
jgi:ADP-ribosyl-[dinitrogen reductase] hydrolase